MGSGEEIKNSLFWCTKLSQAGCEIENKNRENTISPNPSFRKIGVWHGLHLDAVQKTGENEIKPQ